MSGAKSSPEFLLEFKGNPGSNKKVTFNFIFLVLSSLIVNVLFCHEDVGVDLCKWDILIV